MSKNRWFFAITVFRFRWWSSEGRPAAPIYHSGLDIPLIRPYLGAMGYNPRPQIPTVCRHPSGSLPAPRKVLS